jgi:hypothetical protein
MIGGQQQTLIAYIPRTELLLVRRAVSVLTGLGWSVPQAIGIAANIKAESSFRPDATGDGGQAYGLCQWHADRQARFSAKFAATIRGATFREQLLFIDFELRTAGPGGEKGAGDALLAATTPQAAAEAVCRRYERPADLEGESSKRAGFAGQFATALA